MTAITDQPTNKNFLSPLGFAFSIKKTPNVNYFVQSATLPSITLGQSDVQTPFVKLPIPGDHLAYGTFTVSFRVDEDMRNYQELYDWITALGFPDDFGQFNSISSIRSRFGGAIANPLSGDGAFSDASLIILNSVKAPIVEFKFKELYPIELSELLFDTKSTDVEYVEGSVTFAYRSFSLNRSL